MLVRDQRRVTEERALICIAGCAVPRNEAKSARQHAHMCASSTGNLHCEDCCQPLSSSPGAAHAGLSPAGRTHCYGGTVTTPCAKADW